MVEIKIRSSGNLSHSSDTWFYCKQSPVIIHILFNFSFLVRSWSDQTHLTEKHIEKLRQFVYGIFFDYIANPRFSRIRFYFI